MNNLRNRQMLCDAKALGMLLRNIAALSVMTPEISARITWIKNRLRDRYTPSEMIALEKLAKEM